VTHPGYRGSEFPPIIGALSLPHESAQLPESSDEDYSARAKATRYYHTYIHTYIHTRLPPRKLTRDQNKHAARDRYRPNTVTRKSGAHDGLDRVGAQRDPSCIHARPRAAGRGEHVWEHLHRMRRLIFGISSRCRMSDGRGPDYGPDSSSVKSGSGCTAHLQRDLHDSTRLATDSSSRSGPVSVVASPRRPAR